MKLWMSANVGTKPLTSELNYQNRNMPIDEGLRSTVDPETGEYKKGWIRSLGNALKILPAEITKQNYYKQQRVHDEIDTHNDEVRRKEQQNAQTTRDTEFENWKKQEQHKNAVKTWEREKEKHGKILPELDYHAETQHARDNWQSGVRTRPDSEGRSRWYQRDDAERDAAERVGRRSASNSAAERWNKENPKPETPAPLQPEIVDTGTIRVKKVGQNPIYAPRLHGDNPVDMNESVENTIRNIVNG